MSRITSTFNRLLEQARISGRDQHRPLMGGARLSVRAAGDTITLTISRAGVGLGEVELDTFRADCGVPDDAQRWPEEGQHTIERGGVYWHLVAFRWSALSTDEEPPLFDEGRPELEAGDEQIVEDARRAVEQGGYGYEESAL